MSVCRTFKCSAASSKIAAPPQLPGSSTISAISDKSLTRASTFMGSVSGLNARHNLDGSRIDSRVNVDVEWCYPASVKLMQHQAHRVRLCVVRARADLRFWR